MGRVPFRGSLKRSIRVWGFWVIWVGSLLIGFRVIGGGDLYWLDMGGSLA